ncbi:M36 family metallopeptidase [Nocardioides renjunii]|uniref:M36 family metallopeptidase n=1 Tax=Nocardioides renjunii TaxID=3095075 RepID=UPI002AFF924C|nr:M36 family metallopeptidase [Nocardioides sp. S-34]WQQ20439.1 M36 family metallopeptidase [Nocardioides sp. S-34]
MHLNSRVGGVGAALVTLSRAAALAPFTSSASSAGSPPAGPPGGGAGFQGEDSASRDKDVRDGRAAPTARQRSALDDLDATARWNKLGTPAVLMATDTPLATGLPADPETAALEFLAGTRDVLGLTARGAESVEVLASRPLGEDADVVIVRQQFGDLAAGVDGIAAVGMRNGSVLYVSSSLARDAAAPAPATLTEADAQGLAARDAGIADPVVLGTTEVAVPVPGAAARAAFQVVLRSEDDETAGFASYVDARSGEVLVREDLVDHDADNPEWEVFPSSPPVDYSSRDTRVTWCWTPLTGCEETVGTSASLPWDVDPTTNQPTFTTLGNNAIAVENRNSNNSRTVGTETATPSPTRDYADPWTNQWYEEGCDPATFGSPQNVDLDAARANLFAMHNRMHDWSYHLGFVESTWNMQKDNLGRGGLGGDYEQGNAQAGAVSGGPPTFAARNNANQFTPPDGQAPITNMYMWQPIAGSFYAPCVDGDYDMSVIGHEYGHAITNRMIAGPSGGVSSPQGMSESWSDQLAMEYLHEHGYAAPGLQAFTIGQYTTGDAVAGIRNYNMSRSPLNYTDIGYDVTGPQVHADGEIWTATNFDIRQAFIARYGAGDAALNKSCANGQTPVSGCPGNRRWMQLVFDSFLLMANSQVSQVDSRNAMLAADLLRFNGANQDILWNAFAARGLGEGATSAGNADPDPTPSFRSAYASESAVTFAPRDERGRLVRGAQLYVGHYQARAVPVADTDPTTALPDRVEMVPGNYEFVARAPGHGHARIPLTALSAGRAKTLAPRMDTNLASVTNGAAVEGTGTDLVNLVDDEEGTQWAALGAPVAQQHVVVDLAGTKRQDVRRVQVSTHLRPARTNPDGTPAEPSQSRYSALRQFEVWSCSIARGVDCDEQDEFTRVFLSPEDAFPATAPRPRAPDLVIRSFDIRRTKATHLWLQVVTNQCTGGPEYAGEQDQDPRAVTDCSAGSDQDLNVRATEFQAFGR